MNIIEKNDGVVIKLPDKNNKLRKSQSLILKSNQTKINKPRLSEPADFLSKNVNDLGSFDNRYEETNQEPNCVNICGSSPEPEIIDLTEQDTNSEFDDEVIELFEIKNMSNPFARDTYYDNDTVVDAQEVLKRWNIKKLSDPNKNLSVSNYRSKFIKNSSNNQVERRFKPNIYELDEKSPTDISNTIDSTNCLNKSIYPNLNQDLVQAKDARDLKDKLDSLDQKEKSLVDNYNLKYQESLNKLNKVLSDQKEFIEANFKSKSAKINKKNLIKKLYKEALNNLDKSYQDLVNEAKASNQAQKNALMDLFESGNYQNGKIAEYTVLEVYQPSAKRRRYDDNGYRIMLLPESCVKNILIEDEIYNFFYGKPKTF